MRILLQAAASIDRLNERIADVVRWALLANALLITCNALSRKLFSVAWANAFDMQWHFFAAVVLLMAAYTFKRDEHVRIDIFAHRLGERGLAWLDLVGIIIVLLPVCAAMVWVSWPDFFSAVQHSETRSTRESTSDLPAWIIKGFIPLGFFMLGLQGIAEAVRCVAALRGIVRRPIHRRQLIEGGEHDI
ncbi:MAG: TRAP transporter small permease subunit [Pseudomonadota bacterium]|nr:TRAP transporter small permease subunit [Afipia sp.]